MPACKDCKFYKADEHDSAKGDCFGHEVEAEKDANYCPQDSFQPKDIEE